MEDKPVDYDGTTLSVGKDMVEELRENDSMAFNFVDSRTAEDGLENGTYYMVITIPGRLFRKWLPHLWTMNLRKWS